MKKEIEANLKQLDAAVAPERVTQHSPLSSDVIRNACAKLGVGATKSEVKDMEAAEPERLAGMRHRIKNSAPGAKPEFIRRRAAAALEIAAGKDCRVQSLIEIQQERRTNRQAGDLAAMPAAGRQVAIVQAIIARVADKIEAAAADLSDFNSTPLAKLLLNDTSDVAKVFKKQAATLRMFGAKLHPTIYFNWKQTLTDFGIPF